LRVLSEACLLTFKPKSSITEIHIMKPIAFLFISFILVCGYQNPAQAQYSVYDFDPVVVTGSLSETQLSSSLRKITVIDRNAIRLSGAESVDRFLQDIVGVDVRSRGPMGASLILLPEKLTNRKR